MFRRNAVTEPRQRMTKEMSEGLDHLRKAAGQATKQAYAAAKPGVDKAVGKVRHTRREARKAATEANKRASEAALALRGKKHRQWPLAVLALAGGLVVGGVASLLSKLAHKHHDEQPAS